MNDAQKKPRRKFWRGVLFSLVCIVTLTALFYAEEDWRGAHDWNAFKRDWEAKGEKFALADFIPPQVPEDQNFALAPVVASTYGSMLDKNGHEILPRKTNIVGRLQFNLNHGAGWSDMPTNGSWAMGSLTDLKGWQTYYRTPYTNRAGMVTNDFPTAPQPQTPAADVLLALSKYDGQLQELREAARLPESRFPLEYDKEDPAAILLPHLAALKRCVAFLQLRAVAELQAGQTDKAEEDVNLMFRLNRALHAEPFSISHLVRIAMLNTTLQPIYEGLAEHRWTDAQLGKMEGDLAELDSVSDYQRCMRSEAAFTAKMIDYLDRTRKVEEYASLFNSSDLPRNRWIPISYICPGGWFRQNQISFAKFYLTQCLPLADPVNQTFLPGAAKQAEASLEVAMAHPMPHDFLESILLPPTRPWFFESARKFAYAQASTDLARVAVALERYKLAHGDYPDSLDALAPEFVKTAPNDVVGGQPLKYRKTDHSFILYSIGWNEKDDGGTVARTENNFLDPNKGDWVWRYPTK